MSETRARVKGEAGVTRPRGRTLIVLGNGPSLSDFDFSRFSPFDTIGMNAAYRFWDRIGWYPRYYICLDAVVGQSHKPAIERLIRERKQNCIELFVLRKTLVEQFPPDLRHDERIMLFEHLRETSKLFTPMPFTTGSHAALVGAQLGYRRMHLMGVDADYVERIEGAEDRGGDVLQIGTTPKRNPNYFVKDYQLEGDKYTVPNPIPDLHVTCWKEVHDVLKANNIAVWNGSTKSRVDFIPFRSFEDLEAEEGAASAAPAPGDGSRGDTVSTARLQYDRAAKASVDESAVVADLMAERTGSRHILIDVGAHRGGSAVHFDTLGWRILCFEPDRKNREKLTARFGKSATVTIDPRAVSDAPAKGLPFFASNESTGISGLHAFRDTHRQIATVNATSVAEIVSEKGLSAIDFLKIDVEGHELAVLKGVPWDRIKPDAIECEFEDSKTAALGYTYPDMADLLVGLGYTVYVSEWHPILRYGQRHDWCRLTRYPAALLSPQAWGNILAFSVDPGIAALEQSFRACLQFEGSKSMLAKVSATEGQEAKPAMLAKSSSATSGNAPAFVGEDLVGVNLSGYFAWCGNFLRRRPAVPIGFAVVLIALVAAAIWRGAVPYRPAIWVLLEALVFGWLLLTGLGYTGTLARKVDRRLQRQREAMMDAVARGQRETATLDNRLNEVTDRTNRIATGANELAGRVNKLAIGAKELLGHVNKVTSRVDGDAGRVSETERQMAKVAARLEDMSSRMAELARLASEGKNTAARAEAVGPRRDANSATPTFSIVIPTRNRADTLKWALRTCLDSDHPNFEVIVSDNDSSDNTAEVVASFNDPRVRYVKTPTYVSMSRNFENGLKYARGEFLIFFGDDDGILPFGLRVLEAIFQKRPDVDTIDWIQHSFLWPHRPTASVTLNWVSNLRGPETETAEEAWYRINHPRSIDYNELNGFCLYHGCFRRRVVEAAEEAGPLLFEHPVPDVSSSMRALRFAKKKLQLDLAITITGTSQNSTGIALTTVKPNDYQRQMRSEFHAKGKEEFPTSPLVEINWTRLNAFLSPLIEEHLCRRGDLTELDLSSWRVMYCEYLVRLPAEQVGSLLADVNVLLDWCRKRGAANAEPLSEGDVKSQRNATRKYAPSYNAPFKFSLGTLIAAARVPELQNKRIDEPRIVSMVQRENAIIVDVQTDDEQFSIYDYVQLTASMIRCEPYDMVQLLVEDPAVFRSKVISNILGHLVSCNG